MEQDSLIPNHKFIFISPEYNGSIPGVLKTLLDLSDYKKVWNGKKSAACGNFDGPFGQRARNGTPDQHPALYEG